MIQYDMRYLRRSTLVRDFHSDRRCSPRQASRADCDGDTTIPRPDTVVYQSVLYRCSRYHAHTTRTFLSLFLHMVVHRSRLHDLGCQVNNCGVRLQSPSSFLESLNLERETSLGLHWISRSNEQERKM